MSTIAFPNQSPVEFAPVEELLDEIRAGRMVVIVDDEDRENEGDLVMAAEFAGAAAINFMAVNGRGLICLALDDARADHLKLRPMASNNGTRHETAFTVSIEAREGVTTGISAADRARTIAVAVDPAASAGDLVTPGHVFPLRARDGGVLVRAGHTEAAVDLSRMAGLNPAGVICEIMSKDGSMARLPELVQFARAHGLKIGTIADMIAYRRRTDVLIELVREEKFVSERGGEWRACIFANVTEGTEHLALVKGEIDPAKPTLVRVHRSSILDDALSASGGRAGMIAKAMDIIGREGSGILLMIRDFESLKYTELFDAARRGRGKPSNNVLREYGMGAQILHQLGIRSMELLTNKPPASIAGLEGYGISVAGLRILYALPGPRDIDAADFEAEAQRKAG